MADRLEIVKPIRIADDLPGLERKGISPLIAILVLHPAGVILSRRVWYTGHVFCWYEGPRPWFGQVVDEKALWPGYLFARSGAAITPSVRKNRES